MHMIIPALRYANRLFTEGKTIAKAILNVCIIGAMATAHLITSLLDEDSIEAEVEPP